MTPIHERRMRPRLQALRDGDLPAAARAAVAAHVAACAHCARQLRRLEEADGTLVGARPEPEHLPPPLARDLFQRALAEAGIRRASRRRPPLVLLCGAGAAVAAGICAAALLVGRPAVQGTGGTRIAALPAGPAGVSQEAAAATAPGSVRRQDEASTSAKAGRTTGRPGVPIARVEAAASTRRAPPRRLERRARARDRRRVADRSVRARDAAAEWDEEPQPIPARRFMVRRYDPRFWGAGSPQPRLLVMVTHRPPLRAAITQRPADAPGFARVVSVRRSDDGGWVRSELTVSSGAGGAGSRETAPAPGAP